MVVYGAMSQQPLMLPPSLFIFRDIRVRGYWLTGGLAKVKEGVRAKEALADRVCALFRQRVLRASVVTCVPLTQWEHALATYRQSHKGSKVLLTNYADDVCM
jgi:mitochondrial enoyl-[acyl-carrier protein] reductase / trans-2-enoyl-CoA reductase